MLALTLFSTLICGPDVHRLGDREYRVREQSHKRLAAWGWVALPLLADGLKSECLERGERCHRLLCGLKRLDDYLVGVLVAGDDGVSDESLVRLRAAVGRVADEMVPLTVVGLTPEQRTVLTGDTAAWMAKPRFYGGTEGGEVRVVLRAIRQKILCGE